MGIIMEFIEANEEFVVNFAGLIETVISDELRLLFGDAYNLQMYGDELKYSWFMYIDDVFMRNPSLVKLVLPQIKSSCEFFANLMIKEEFQPVFTVTECY